jgi:hypothetical protein
LLYAVVAAAVVIPRRLAKSEIVEAEGVAKKLAGVFALAVPGNWRSNVSKA